VTPRKPPEHDERWVAGHDAGYAKGRDDGIGIGWGDAKLRVFLTISAIEDSSNGKVNIRDVRGALTQVLGKQV
jgi:hypothetical protein